MKNLLLSACCLAALAANAEEYSLVGRRYLRLYSAPEATPVYNAEAEAQRIVREMCNVPWTRSDETNAVSTSHANESLDDNVANRQRFDAAIFCSHHTDSRHVAHANAACYVYRLPAGTLPNLTSLSATLTCDTYNALGARLVLMTSDTPDIPTDCQVVRGESGGGVKLAAIAPRITRQRDGKDYWYPNTTNAVFTVPDAPRVAGAGDLPSGGIQLRQYLFLFVLMENYSMSRGNWLEGCAWIENAVSITTDAPVPGWTDGATVNLFDAADDPAAADDDGITYVDTLGDAIPSADSAAYLLADGYRMDSDNDGLSNFMEYLSSTVLTNDLGTPVVRADRKATNGLTFGGAQAVPDYFLPVGNTYLGAMLTDHDFIEDWLEDSVFFHGDRHASRYECDADKDFDVNGWDNWSEARAYIAARGVDIPVDAGADASFRPTPTGRIKVVYNGETYRHRLGNLVIQAYRYRNGAIPPMTVAPDATWVLPMTGTADWYALGAPSRGALCGGKNMFVVYNDADTDGRWTAGEPYGIVTDVEVSYSRIADATVEITDVNPSIMRIDLQKALATTGYEAQNALTDRGVNSYSYYSNVIGSSNAFSYAVSQTGLVRIRVVRTAINGQSVFTSQNGNSYLVQDTVLDVVVDPKLVPMLSEWALLYRDFGDLDMRLLAERLQQMNGYPIDRVTDVTYSVVIGPDDPVDRQDQCNYLSVAFVNGFEYSVAPNKPNNPVATGIVDPTACHPTFQWTHAAPKVYPVFALRIMRGGTLIRQFPNMRTPPKDKYGVYRWTCPYTVGAELENNVAYTYQVMMMDAKFQNLYPSDAMPFTMNVSGLGGDLADGYSIYAAVKYFGPVSATVNNVRVEAFETPDFTGLPAAASYVTDVAQLASTTTLTWNAQLIGLKPGVDYYVRAFVDSNGNGVKDATETWGYGNYVGSERKDLYTPRAYPAKQGSFQMPMSVVYIEDVSIPPVDIKGIVSSNLLQNVSL